MRIRLNKTLLVFIIAYFIRFLLLLLFHGHTATLDNLETKLTIPDDNDSVSIRINASESKKTESSGDSTANGKIEFVGQNGAVLIYIFAIGA